MRCSGKYGANPHFDIFKFCSTKCCHEHSSTFWFKFHLNQTTNGWDFLIKMYQLIWISENDNILKIVRTLGTLV